MGQCSERRLGIPLSFSKPPISATAYAPALLAIYFWTSMTSTITTVSFFVLALVTMALQLMMYVDRAKFIKTLKGQKGLFSLSGSSIERFGTMIQIVFPVKLEIVTDEKLNKLRESAVKTSRYWMISLFLTLTLPIILFKLLG